MPKTNPPSANGNEALLHILMIISSVIAIAAIVYIMLDHRL
ncbi:MAG: hypothetical protein ABJA57_11565 [Ginsengibacter sp.]